MYVGLLTISKLPVPISDSRILQEGRPCKNFLTCSLINMQNLVVVSSTECTHGPKKIEDAGGVSVADGDILG